MLLHSGEDAALLVELVRQRQREPFRLQEPSAFSCCVTCAAMAARGAADICCYGGGIPPRCVLYAVLVQHACTEQAKKATAVSRRVRRQPEKSQGTPVQALRRREGLETKKSACRAKAAHSDLTSAALIDQFNVYETCSRQRLFAISPLELRQVAAATDGRARSAAPRRGRVVIAAGGYTLCVCWRGSQRRRGGDEETALVSGVTNKET